MSRGLRRHLRPNIPASAIPMAHCRRCACSPIRCRRNCWPSRAAGSSTSSISIRFLRRREEGCWRNSSTRAMCRSGWTSSVVATRPVRWSISRPARARHSPIRTCGCFLISSTRSGSCPTWRPAMRWRTCWQRGTMFSGTTIRWSWRREPRPGSGWRRCHPCARRFAAGMTRRRSRFPAVSSRLV